MRAFFLVETEKLTNFISWASVPATLLVHISDEKSLIVSRMDGNPGGGMLPG